MCRFDSPCKANKPTGHETESTTRKRGRLPSNGLSSFRSRDVEHRHYVVCRRVHVAGLSASPCQGTEEKQAREYARGQSQRRFFECKFYSVSFLSRSSISLLPSSSVPPPDLPSPFLPSFHFLFKLLFLPTIPRDRLYASSVNSTYRGSFVPATEFYAKGKTGERKREN